MRRRLAIAIVLTAIGFAASAPAAVSAPDQSPDVNFGSQQAGTTSAPTLVTINNTAGPDLNVTGFSIGGTNPAAFNAVANGNDTCSGQTLVTGGSCTVDVTFAPGVAAQFSATLLLVSDSASSPDLVANLAGTGTPAPAPGISITPSSPFDFGNQKVGTGTSQVFTVSNTGNADLDITTASALGDFSVPGGSDGCSGTTVAAGHSCQVTVQYQPSAAGPVAGQLSVSSTELAPAVVELDGTGTVPQAVPDGTTSFSTPMNVAQVLSISLTNKGSAPLVVTGAQLSNDTDPAFTRIVDQGTCGGAVLQHDDSCFARVQFLPTTVKQYSGALVFTDDDNSVPGSTQQVQLTGTVLVPGIHSSPASVPCADTTAGRLSPRQTITITNTGGANLRVSEISITGADPANFALGGQTCTDGPIAPNTSCTVNVRFAPRSSGQRIATLAVASDAGATLDVALTGRGVPPPDVTNERAAAGCTDVRISWVNPDAPGLKKVVLVRNGKRYPRSPGDGTIIRHTRATVLDTAPRQFHVYYYALFAVYTSYDKSHTVVSHGVDMRARLGRICSPRNGSLVSDLTPLVDWTGYPKTRSYAFILQHSGHTILVRYPRKSEYQFASSWRYAGSSHSLAHRQTYVFYLYAYTARHPGGLLIGHATWTER